MYIAIKELKKYLEVYFPKYLLLMKDVWTETRGTED